MKIKIHMSYSWEKKLQLNILKSLEEYATLEILMEIQASFKINMMKDFLLATHAKVKPTYATTSELERLWKVHM